MNSALAREYARRANERLGRFVLPTGWTLRVERQWHHPHSDSGRDYPGYWAWRVSAEAPFSDNSLEYAFLDSSDEMTDSFDPEKFAAAVGQSVLRTLVGQVVARCIQ